MERNTHRYDDMANRFHSTNCSGFGSMLTFKGAIKIIVFKKKLVAGRRVRYTWLSLMKGIYQFIKNFLKSMI